jgi:hypothetical protein
MDLTQTIIAKSDQLNADDLIAGPQTFTVADVRMGDSEQPVWIVLAELGKARPFKPSKTVLRILVHAWGKESDEWPKGARMTLYRDADVKWAGQAIGGIRVSHLSHIDKKLKVALQESKGKKVLYTVEPLPDEPAEPTPTELAAQIAVAVADATTEAEVRELGNRAHARNLLDVEVRGEIIRNLVTDRLAELAKPTNADEQATLDEAS